MSEEMEPILERELEDIAQILSVVRHPGEGASACLQRIVVEHQRHALETSVHLAALLRTEATLIEWRQKATAVGRQG